MLQHFSSLRLVMFRLFTNTEELETSITETLKGVYVQQCVYIKLIADATFILSAFREFPT